MKNLTRIILALTFLQVPVACRPYEYNYSRGGKGDIARNIVLGACAVGIVGAASCIKIVSTGNECLVERLGKFHRSLGPGVLFVLSPIERISFQDTIREQVVRLYIYLTFHSFKADILCTMQSSSHTHASIYCRWMYHPRIVSHKVRTSMIYI